MTFVYETVANAGNPYRVEYGGGDIVEVYEQEDPETGNTRGIRFTRRPLEYLMSFKPERIIIGGAILNRTSEMSGGHGREFKGNSILLDLGNNVYVFIGARIYSFRTDEKLLKLYSPVGNSRVPYPFVHSVRGNVYLLLEKKVLIGNYSNEMNPYDILYEKRKKAKKMDVLWDIEPPF